VTSTFWFVGCVNRFMDILKR